MKILLIRVSSLGDVLHNMPVIDDIKAHYPDAEIDWVVEEAYVNLVKLQPKVRKVIPYAQRRWRKSLGKQETRAEIKHFYRSLREEAYDLILETQGLLKTGIIMGMARKSPTGKKVGLANGTEGSGYEALSRIFHDQSVATDKRCHAVQRGRIVAAAALGYELKTPASFGLQKQDLTPAWMPQGPYVVFFHATAGESKKWARNNWIKTARDLQVTGLPILLPWGNDAEKQEAEAMAAQMSNATVLPKLSMQEATVLAQRAALVIGVDTGLVHIAAAYETPTIELYCDSPRWKTEGNWSPKIINLGDKGMPPSVAEVEIAFEKLLGITKT
ncbi:lipopolysaccharide heptosyltransferase I [Undibacterium cyanobacteriorum]|uniref:Lipopolysaccharide heptosyltransferase 1 n=1 Tax=Undibacterium cyanobacteriorum TaxID=3073561 RepID=A0ABY9RE76_9BURK|nr:lipopolysaccharide heptosyltransferase I [Undibacterium sp. 20NA77.5]WMW79261.1 lipopolysaccharide heptosyltransferase I [Undibacterium sp. 20NA77.5]